MTLGGILSPALAQVDPRWDSYKGLFSKNTQDPAAQAILDFTRGTFIRDAASGKVTGLKFTFSAQFTLTAEEGRGSDKWFWDHIVSPLNDEEELGFILRLCPESTSSTSDEGCILGTVPYRNYPKDCELTSVPVIQGLPELVSGWDCTSPVDSYKRAIYKYSQKATGPFNIRTYLGSGVKAAYRRTNFSVDFDIENWFLPKTRASTEIKGGQSYRADMWYCSGNPESDPDRPIAPPRGPGIQGGDPEMRNFGWNCKLLSSDPEDARAYFMAGTPSRTLFIPDAAQGDVIVDQQTGAGATNEGNLTQSEYSEKLPVCSIIPPKIMGCVARIVYYVVYWPANLLAGLMGNLFDFFLGYSLDDESYRQEFVVRGWQLVRDISNIFFIIILIWTGLAAVFDISGISMKKVVPSLIINALIINFSLFATRAVIDLSNVVSRIFYNTITVCEGECRPRDPVTGEIPNIKEGAGSYTPLSEKIVASFNPQKIFSKIVIAQELENTSTDEAQRVDASASGLRGGIVKKSRDDSDYAGYFILVSLLAGLILFSVAMMFWKTALLFLGRVVGLYVVMIFAPFAFLTRGNIPLVNKLPQISWTNWVKDLTSYALQAPIFVFFLYVIYLLVQSDMTKIFEIQANASFLETVLSICVPLGIIYFLIGNGVSIAKKYSGAVGEFVQNSALKAAGVAGGVALGVASLGGSRLIGTAGRALDQSKFGVGVRNMAAKGGIQGWVGKKMQTGLNKSQSGSFDVRQTAIGQGLFKQMGVNTDGKYLNALSTVGIGPGLATDQRKGGLDAAIKRRQEAQERDAALLEEKMDIDGYNKKRKEAYAKRKEKVQKEMDEKIKASEKWDDARLKQWRETASQADQQKKELAIADQKGNEGLKLRYAEAQQPPPQDLRSAEEMTSERRKAFAENLKKPSLLAKTGIGNTWVGGIVGAATGASVRIAGDKKAAKKIEEKVKIEKKLGDIKDVLKKGFQDLIAMEDHQNSAAFQALSTKEKEDLVKYGKIQEGANKGKRLYDILGVADQAAIDKKALELRENVNIGTKDQKEAAKKKLEMYEEMVKTQEGSRYSMKTINEDLKKARDLMQKTIVNPRATQKQREDAKKDYLAKLEEKTKAKKHEETWRDVNKYMEEQKKKLKGEEGK